MHIIVDLDGTLANVDHRTNLVRRAKPKFDNFFKLCYKDKLNDWCRALILGMVELGNKVDIVSARPLSTYQMTKDWMEKHLVLVPGVTLHILRGEKDFTPDVELKRKWLQTQDKREILFVVDDRKRVVDMWREEGLVCLQCYEWEEFKNAGKTTKPSDPDSKRTVSSN